MAHMILDLNPAHNQVQDLQLRYEAIAINIDIERQGSQKGLRHRDITEDVYILLYYSSSDYKTDGKFRKIKVRVKGNNYRINHQAGYIAD